MIYLDNAATTLKKPPCVIDAVTRAMTTIGNAERGAHGSSLGASRMIYQTREKIADFFGCGRADHVIFTSNATEALNIAICGAIPNGAHVISTDLEHNSVLRPLYYLERERGVSLSFLAADDKGNVELENLESWIRPGTKAIVCTHASNLTGQVLDLEFIGGIARKHGLLFIVDASQTAGEFPIDMERMQIDILCFTGHKGLMGPQGTGGLCIRQGVEIRPWKRGGSGIHSYEKDQPEPYPTRLEAGTLNAHGIAGLSAAIDYIRDVGLDAIRQRETALACQFHEALRGTEGIAFYGDCDDCPHAAIVSLNVRNYDSSYVADILSEDYEIAVRAGAHCAPRMHQALHTVEQGAVRFSFGWFNTEEEVEAAAEAVKEIAADGK